MVKNLADRYAGIDADRLDGEHFQRPVAAEPDVAKPGCHVDEEAQSSQRAAAFDHGYQLVGFGHLDRAAQVQLVGIQYQALGRYRQPPHPVGLPQVQDHLFVGHQLVMQREVVAVGVQPLLFKGLNHQIVPQTLANFVPG